MMIDYNTGGRYTGKATLLSRKQVAARLNRSLPHVSNQVKAGLLSVTAIDSRSGAQHFRLSDVKKYERNGGR